MRTWVEAPATKIAAQFSKVSWKILGSSSHAKVLLVKCILLHPRLNVCFHSLNSVFPRMSEILLVALLVSQYVTFAWSVGSDDVTFALKDSKELPWLAKYL